MSEKPESDLLSDAMQNLYRNADQTRSKFGGDTTAAARYYKDFVGFISAVASASSGETAPHLLDVGCGAGWSSFFLTKAGFRVTGVDLNPDAFEPPVTDTLILQAGSALKLDFDDRTFDVVTAYQCIEHLPDPELGLNEMIRVLRPGGVLAIVGPNLLSPLFPIRQLMNELIRGQSVFRRTTGLARHPYGNTAPEHFGAFFSTLFRLASKLMDSDATFTMREPDYTPPFHGDNDACYLCNPTDLIKFVRGKGFTILQTGRPGRPPFSNLFASGTWFAARRL
jgi:SAM-dependent methyltransferase